MRAEIGIRSWQVFRSHSKVSSLETDSDVEN